jgi:hypothetical protein
MVLLCIGKVGSEMVRSLPNPYVGGKVSELVASG